MNSQKKAPPSEDDKVSEGTTAYNQNGKTKSDTTQPPPGSDMQQFATKADIESVKHEITKSHIIPTKNMADNHAELKEDMANNHAELKEDLVETNRKVDAKFAKLEKMILVGIIVLILNLTGLPEYMQEVLSTFLKP